MYTAPDRNYGKTILEHSPNDHFSYQPQLHMILEANTIKFEEKNR